MKTHDICLPLSSNITPATGNSHASRKLRVLLLSPSSMSEQKLPFTIERIRRFASLTGGRDLVIVFLLYSGNATFEEASTEGMVAYAKLQAEMMDHGEIPSIPILPLPKLGGLASLLKGHQTALSAPRASKSQRSRVTSFDLLRHCSIDPPMSESAAFMLTGLFANLREIANACSMVSTPQRSSSPSGGLSGVHATMQSTADTTVYDDEIAQSKLRSFRQLTSEDQYHKLLDFWTAEFAA